MVPSHTLWFSLPSRGTKHAIHPEVLDAEDSLGCGSSSRQQAMAASISSRTGIRLGSHLCELDVAFPHPIHMA